MARKKPCRKVPKDNAKEKKRKKMEGTQERVKMKDQINEKK